MDIDAQRAKLENDRRSWEQWIDDERTQQIFADLSVQEDRAIQEICTTPKDLESFFAHFAACGVLRGVRLPGLKVQGKIEEIQEQIKAIPK